MLRNNQHSGKARSPPPPSRCISGVNRIVDSTVGGKDCAVPNRSGLTATPLKSFESSQVFTLGARCLFRLLERLGAYLPRLDRTLPGGSPPLRYLRVPGKHLSARLGLGGSQRLATAGKQDLEQLLFDQPPGKDIGMDPQDQSRPGGDGSRRQGWDIDGVDSLPNRSGKHWNPGLQRRISRESRRASRPTGLPDRSDAVGQPQSLDGTSSSRHLCQPGEGVALPGSRQPDPGQGKYLPIHQPDVRFLDSRTQGRGTLERICKSQQTRSPAIPRGIPRGV